MTIRNSSIAIADRLIGSGNAPYIIAEMSANHNGKIENAFRIIEAAKCEGSRCKEQLCRSQLRHTNKQVERK